MAIMPERGAIMRGVMNIDRAYFRATNHFEFPELEPIRQPVNVEKWLSFQERGKAAVYGDTGVHFYADDYTFECLWNTPGKYVEQLQRYKLIVQPDFSLYYNFPVALQVYNKYRNHWLARYLAYYGCKIVPNVNPSRPDLWSWTLDGFPRRSVVAFSDIGSFRDTEDRQTLQAGFQEMIHRLKPIQVLYFCRSVENAPAGVTPIVVSFGG